MTAGTIRFCSLKHQRLGEPLVGKGGHVEPHLLLAWPRRKWADHVYAAKDMPATVSSRLEAIQERGWRVQLVDRRDHDHSKRCVLSPMSGHEFSATDAELPDLLDALLNDEAKAKQWRIGPTAPRLLLCCTHGKVDKCCAKFGNAAYHAIRNENAAGGYGFDVWESSHVGGCRFAANVVALPTLRRYGWVTEASIQPLLASEAAGRPYLPCFRGTAGLNALQQCADLAARQWLAERNIDTDPVVADVEVPESPCERSVTVYWNDGARSGALSVHCRSRELIGPGNCGDMAEGGSYSFLPWWVDSITPVSVNEFLP